MSTQHDASSEQGLLRDALRTIRTLKSRVAALESPGPVEIAIVGMSARFPGASTLDDFGKFLAIGGDAIAEPSSERLKLWERARVDAAIEAGLPIKGGYVDWPIDKFDNDYFRISLREAASMDPQQRLALELSIEALEHAGVPPQSLRGSLTGVFYGMNNEDFTELGYRTGARSGVDTYAYTGNAYSVAAGRVSYVLDLRGPNIAIDTACSSSLVAIQLACRALAAKECNVALAGGISLILSDAATTALHRLNALSVDGRCWSFDARANGYARAEGGAVLVLKRLDDAIAAGDHVHAVIMGAAVNHGGAASGLTAPNGSAQAALVRTALRAANLAPDQIDYVEAHGTGTPLGDPIEVGALAEVFAGNRTRPLLLTSVKANVGHLEAAAGVCGLVKMVLALSRNEVPPQAKLGTLNPALDLASIPAEVPREARPWLRPASGRRIGGVSSFGISGTNAHVIVADAPLAPSAGEASREGVEPIFVLSGMTAGALRDVARNTLAFLTNPALSERDIDIASTSCTRRDRHAHRLAILGGNREEWAAALRGFLDGDKSRVVVSEVAPGAHRVAFVFGDVSGAADARLSRLIETSVEARAFFGECSEVARTRLGIALPDDGVGDARDEAAALWLQIRHFAVGVSLCRQWERAGLVPDALVGVGAGELAAAFAAGALALEDALRLVLARTRVVGIAGYSTERKDPSAVMSKVAGELGQPPTPRLALFSPNGKRWALDDATLSRLASPVADPNVVASVRERGFSTLVDLSPVRNEELSAGMLPTVSASGDVTILRSLVDAHCAGAPILWSRYYGVPGRVVPLPTYPWQRVSVDLPAGRANVANVGANDTAPGSQVAQILMLSGRSDDAVRAKAREFRGHLSNTAHREIVDLCFTATTTDLKLERRAAVVAKGRDEIGAALDALANGVEDPRVTGPVQAPVGGAPPKVAFVFPGQGSQWLGMGRELFESNPVFREAMTACDRAIFAETGWSLLEELKASPERSRMKEVDVVQPALFAMSVCLAAVWRAWGVEPSIVIGQSQGEVAAAYVAGALSLRDAAAIICRRSRLLKKIVGRGGMALVQLPLAETEAAMAGYESEVAVAVVNSHRSTVISGTSRAVSEILSKLEARGVFCKRVNVDYASHSPQVDALRDELMALLADLTPGTPVVPMHSTLTGELVKAGELDAAYWVNNLRQPVRLAASMEVLLSEGIGHYLEVSAHPVVQLPLEELRTEKKVAGLVATTLIRERPERASMLETLGKLQSQNVAVDWSAVFPEGSSALDLVTEVQQSGEDTGHPLLGARLPVAGADAVYESVLSIAKAPWLYDHRVKGKALLPGVGLVELVRAAGEHYFEVARIEVNGLVIQAPLMLPERGGQRVQVVLVRDGDAVQASVYSRASTAKSAEKWIMHATGHVRQSSEVVGSSIDPGIAERCTETVDVGRLYEKLAVTGFEYGPAFRGLRRLGRGKQEVFGSVELPDAVTGAELYGIHPALLDAALHATLSLNEDGLALPFSIERLTIHRSGAAAATVSARFTPNAIDAGSFSVDVILADEEGRPIADLKGLQMRAVDPAVFAREETKDVSNHLYRLEWPVAAAPAVTTTPSGRWVVVSSSPNDMANTLAARLEAAGASCRVVEPGRLAEALPAEHVVSFWSGAADEESAAEALRVSSEGLSVVQRLAKESKPPRLRFVTVGGVAAAPGDQVSPALASLWGLGRAVMQEHPELGCALVDIQAGAAGLEQLLHELGREDDEREIAWRADERRAARLVRAPAARLPAGENYGLENGQVGSFDRLGLVAVGRKAPGAGEVEIAVRASGLNFRDVLISLGMFEGVIGQECAGVVAAVGAGVEGFAVGDRVMAMQPGSFQKYVTVDSRQVARVPAGWTFEQAASVPLVFLTAWYALKDLANLQRGERILVHAASGGVGMAAVQVAQWLGAEVVGTASPSKWSVVRGLGVEHVANSRDLSFVEGVRAATRGEGVDVVLNSLTKEFIDKSASLLRKGGRFIEMGVVEVRDPGEMSRSFPGTSYCAFKLFDAGPDRIAEMFRELEKGFASGHLRPIPVHSFPLTEAEGAFRYMAQGRHVGKLVLSFPRELRTDGTVLVTGGLGELGLLVARNLAKRGVKHLVLTGRRGLETPGAKEAVSELEGLGAQVTLAAVDVANREALGRVIAAIGADRPLRGVVHAAGILDDGMLTEQTSERLGRVLSPKAAGAAHLDALTRGADLDIFVTFSSVAGTLGSAGQGSYAAANTFLDGLAARRQHEGLVGQSLAWGLWASDGKATGLAAHLNDAQRARLASSGFGALSASEGIALFELALGRSEAQLVPLSVDLKAFRQKIEHDVPPMWRALVQVVQRAAKGKRGAWGRELAALSAEARAEAVLELVRAEVARVLSLSSPAPADRPLKELGLDSLMGVELRNALGKRAGVTLPATLAFDYPTPAAMTKYLLENVFSSVAAAKPTTPRSVVRPTLDEPIAIVGIGCRFPGGASDPEAFWRMLDDGIDAVTEVPPERWDIDAWYDSNPDAAGKMVTRWAGFLNTREIESFDPAFFGLSPGEARSIDPQQRLLLETTWEALERAGISAEGLVGSDTGVYMGLVWTDYQSRIMRDAAAIDAYSYLGTAHSAIVGRISYSLGLQGPSLAIDTACSSSLVGVHLACQALRNGEVSLALAGGANTIFDPNNTVYLSRLGALSPTGRCHTFSVDADGFVRAEGAGVVVLERLSDARKKGHRVLALIRGSAVNQDGRSNGLTAPNGPSQEAVIREALARGQIEPSSVGYLECHGTGTSLGDPIEVQAAAAVLGEGRPAEHPLVLTSAKSNMGHAEGAAGIAGLIKVVLSMQHGRIPKTLHVGALNPHIPWSELPVTVATESMKWSRTATPRRAGVSSFGFSGTNAHAILEEAPEETAVKNGAPVRSAELVVLSAKVPGALEAGAERLADYLEAHPELSLGDVASNLATTRTHHEQRLALAVTSREALVAGLRSVGGGHLVSGAARDEASSGKVSFLFTGQGAQTLGMGQGLYAEWPVFREALDAAWAALDAHLPRKLREVMWAEPGGADATLIHRTEYTQPALFAVEVALAALWRSWGVRPDYLAGHSIGELAAAHVAGVFSLGDAARLVVARGQLMQALPAGGAMVAIAASEDSVKSALSAAVSLAAVNGPSSVVISGEATAVAAVEESFAKAGTRTKRLEVSHAFHSTLMDPMLAEFRKVAESVTYRTPELPVVSNVTGQLAKEELTRPEYWVNHVRDAVRFAAGVVELHGKGVRKFIEIGPKATLLGLVPACLSESEQERVRLVKSLTTDKPEGVAVLEGLASYYASGGTVNWSSVFAGGANRVELPTYAWQRKRYWIESSETGVRAGDATGHPMLGVRVSMAGGDAVYESVLSRAEESWVYDHRVKGKAIVPGAGLAEVMRAAGEHYFTASGIEVSGVVFESPLWLPDRGGQRLQTVLKQEGDAAQVLVYSQAASAKADEPWTLHATGRVRCTSEVAGGVVDWASAKARCSESLDVDGMYASFEAVGLEYGPAFRGLRRVARGEGEAFTDVELPEGVEAAERYGVHPALMDAAFHAVLALMEEGVLALPFAIDRMSVQQPGASAARVLAKVVKAAGSGFTFDVTLFDDEGRVIAEVKGLQTRAVDAESLGREQGKDVSSHLYRLEWPLAAGAVSPAALSGRWVVVATAGDAIADAVASRLTASGATCRRVDHGRVGEALPADQVVCVWSAGADEATTEEALRVSSEGLDVVQTVLKESKPPRLWWVTAGGVGATPGDLVAPALSALWGLGRTVMQERPELGCTLVDVEAEGAGAEQVVREFGHSDDEREIAWRSGERRVARLVRAPAARLPAGENFELAIGQVGSFDRLGLAAVDREAPGAGEVAIAVRASGLNFRDVLISLGMYPGGGAIGQECAGVVVAVGAGVEGFAVGDRVMGLKPGSFQQYVNIDSRQVSRVPAGWTFEQAASVPSVFLTAWYALKGLANLQRGERILVHAAAGGVGMAAVQVAQWLGAEVLGTASPPKWNVLRGLGVEHVASSRDVSFVDTFRAATRGEGVDVVLNSLTKEFIDKSASLLRKGGRFIEMGAVELRDAAEMSASFPGTSYRAFQLFDAGPDRIAEMFRELEKGFASGHLRPIPVHSFPLTEAEGAFRYMAQGRHVGKLVLSFPRELRTDGTVLVTGGLGDLGQLVARSLARRGVKHLVLTGRRGLETPGAKEAVSELEALGATVTVAAVDVADEDSLSRVVSAIGAERPLRGVVHAAGILDDGMLTEQTAERLARVMSPKVAGAIHLDALTRGADLDVFVTFSSVAGTLGNAGQGPYAAANAFLDGLAARRQEHGLVGQSLAWGLWTSESSHGAGLASRLTEAQRARLVEGGIGALTPMEGIALFEAALTRSDSQLAPFAVDIKALRKRLGNDVPPLWRALIQVTQRTAKGKGGAWARELAALTPDQRTEAVLEVVRGEVARVLSLSGADAAPADTPLKELGLDSLMAVEVRNALGKRAGVTLPATLAFDYPTAIAITKYLLERSFGFVVPETVEEISPDDETTALTAEDVAQLSDDEAVSRLYDELAALENLDVTLEST